MTERSVEPPGGLMTVVAFVATTAFMCIITLVAAVASRWCFQESLVGMTIKTGRLFVLAYEAEAGRVVIKANLDPVDGRVTVAAGSAHCLAMYIVISMAGEAV